MAAKTVPYNTIEVVYFPILQYHPINGWSDITGQTVQVALPVDGTAPSVWSSTTWETGSWWKDGNRYALAKVQLNGTGFALTASTTYRMFAKVGTGPVILKGGTIIAEAA